MDFKKKRKNFSLGEKPFLKIGSVLLALISAYLIFSDINIYQRRRQLESQIQAYEKQIEQVKQRNEKLEQGIAQSGEDSYIEKVAREELDMQKPGEKVVAFILPEQKQEQQKQEQGFWANWLGWLSGIWKK